MATNELILQKAQAGIESTRGTGVAATRKVYARIQASYDKPLATFADTTGTYASRRRAAYGRTVVGFSGTDIATYEDLAWWFQFGLKGGVTGSGSGSVGYTYAFTPSLATDDLKSMTLEFGDDGNPYESTQVMVNSWTLRGDGDSDTEPGWMLDCEMIGRDWSTTTFTGSLSDRSTEVILARGTKIYLDDAAANIGTTQVTGKLISFSITGNNNVHYKAFMEDEDAFAANKVGRGERTFDAQFVLEFDADTEFAKYRTSAPSIRYIRLEREGSTIATTYKKKATIDMAGYWSAISWGDREGNITATFSLSCFYDSTIGADLKATIINALSTLA